jgi:uncharacterized BrkB/YihY/UPF0761 family membrane protein
LPNWRRYLLEPAITALAVIGLVLVVSVLLMISEGDLGHLLPVIVGVVGFGVIVGVVWVGLTAVFSWLLRRRRPWFSILAGAGASALIAIIGLAPLVLQLVTLDGWGTAPAQLLIGSAAGALIAIAIVQTVVHLARARRRGEQTAELG